SRTERPVRRPEAGRRRTRDLGYRLAGSPQDVALLVDRELAEILVEPAVRGELMARRMGRPREIRPRFEGVPGGKDRAPDAVGLEQLEQPWHAHARSEFAVRQLDRWIAAPNGVRDEVGIDREGNGQPGRRGRVHRGDGSDRPPGIPVTRGPSRMLRTNGDRLLRRA